MKAKNFKPIHKYTFKAEDDRGCYDENGNFLRGSKTPKGYIMHHVRCEDGKKHNLLEHRMKWVYFNGELSEDDYIDHIIPISNGGTNKLSNLRVGSLKDNNNNEFSRKNHSISASKRVGELNPFYGKKWNKNQKEANKQHWKAVIQVTANGETKIYPSVAEAAKETNLSYSSIAYACRGRYTNKNLHYYKESYWYYGN